VVQQDPYRNLREKNEKEKGRFLIEGVSLSVRIDGPKGD